MCLDIECQLSLPNRYRSQRAHSYKLSLDDYHCQATAAYLGLSRQFVAT